MKITKYFIALIGFCAIIIWASNTGCTSKQVSCDDAPSFKAVSKILVTHCSKCHGDSTSAAIYGYGYVYNFKDYNLTARDTLNGNPNPNPYFQNLDTTGGYDPTQFGGMTFLDIQGTGFGHPMPLGGPKLTDCEISSIRTWLLNGAPNN